MRFLKVIVPPLVAFFVFAVIIKYNPLHHSFEGLSDIGDGSASGLISYYKIFAPFQLVIAVLTQYLIILPLWDKIVARHKAAIGIFIGLILVCVIAAGGLAYIIWDRAVGAEHLIHIGLFMTGVQLFYWLINFLVMFLFDIKSFLKKDKATEPNH
jgi:hypothetical protein